MSSGSRRLALQLGVAMVLPAAASGRAEASCVSEAIESCDRDFGTWYYKLLGVTWWCYIARVGWCELTESLE